MELQDPHAEAFDDALQIAGRILRVARVNAPDRHQAILVAAAVGADERIDLVSEADHLGGDIVDQHRAIDPLGIEEPEKGGGIGAEGLDEIEIDAPLGHLLESLGPELAPGLDVDVSVDDHVAPRNSCGPGAPGGAARARFRASE